MLNEVPKVGIDLAQFELLGLLREVTSLFGCHTIVDRMESPVGKRTILVEMRSRADVADTRRG